MIGVATNSYFTACFLGKIVDSLGGLINDPSWVVIYCSPSIIPATQLGLGLGTMNGFLSLHSALQGTSTWLVDSAPQLQRYKDQCIALSQDTVTNL